jgi:putative transposase
VRKREVVGYLQSKHGLSERGSCALVGQPRSTQRYEPTEDSDERRLVAAMRSLALSHPRYGYRRIAALLREQGWTVNDKRVERLWRREGLTIRRRPRKKRRLGHAGNGCARLRPLHRNHVWSVDFVSDRTEDGRALKMLVVLDEWTRVCLRIDVARSIVSADVRLALEAAIERHGVPEHVRSDNGPEFVARALRRALAARGVQSSYIEPASPWENGYVESFNSKLRDELLEREVFTSLLEARVMVEDWRVDYNERRPHSALGYVAPAAFAARDGTSGSATLRPTSRPEVECLSPCGT